MAGNPPNFGFVGAGMMAEAIIRGMVSAPSDAVAGPRIGASDPFEARHAAIAKTAPGAFTTDDNVALVQRSDVLVLSVKPQMLKQVVGGIAPHLDAARHLVISIAAGVTTAQLETLLPPGTRVVRVMPNTPCMVGESAAAVCRGATALETDAALVRRMLVASGGTCCEVPESLMDAVTGLSGSGPAYVYLVIEALADGGVRAGLPRNVASDLASQTVLGAAAMVRGSTQHAAQLKDNVCSPGGTTIAGVHALERGGLRAAIMDAVVAATERSKELSKL